MSDELSLLIGLWMLDVAMAQTPKTASYDMSVKPVMLRTLTFMMALPPETGIPSGFT
jgi:hypothetical protein